jgi:hypothetical protein
MDWGGWTTPKYEGEEVVDAGHEFWRGDEGAVGVRKPLFLTNTPSVFLVVAG